LFSNKLVILWGKKYIKMSLKVLKIIKLIRRKNGKNEKIKNNF